MFLLAQIPKRIAPVVTRLRVYTTAYTEVPIRIRAVVSEHIAGTVLLHMKYTFLNYAEEINCSIIVISIRLESLQEQEIL